MSSMNLSPQDYQAFRLCGNVGMLRLFHLRATFYYWELQLVGLPLWLEADTLLRLNSTLFRTACAFIPPENVKHVRKRLLFFAGDYLQIDSPHPTTTNTRTACLGERLPGANAGVLYYQW